MAVVMETEYLTQPHTAVCHDMASRSMAHGLRAMTKHDTMLQCCRGADLRDRVATAAEDDHGGLPAACLPLRDAMGRGMPQEMGAALA